MSKPAAMFIFIFTVAVIGFSTWQLFKGNLEAAFSALPFLLIIYFFIKPYRND